MAGKTWITVADSAQASGEPIKSVNQIALKDNVEAALGRDSGAPWLNGVGGITEYLAGGSGNFTVPAGVYNIIATVVGAGGGGGATGDGAAGSVGGNTTFSATTATGGAGGIGGKQARVVGSDRTGTAGVAGSFGLASSNGGGGGGGGASDSIVVAASGGEGRGGEISHVVIAVTPAQIIAYSIGAGGAGGAGGGSGATVGGVGGAGKHGLILVEY